MTLNKFVDFEDMLEEFKIKNPHAKKMVCFLVCILFLFVINPFGFKKINGESFSLTGIEEKTFLFSPLKVTRVYGYNSNGKIISYTEGVDYKIDYRKGTIRRLNNSQIPDYKLHTVAYNKNNKFLFSNESIRNPELNIYYQIYVDYIYFLKNEHIPSSTFLSDTIHQKLLSGKPIKISLIGDSIAAGAQTTAEYYEGDQTQCTFLGYLKTEIEKIYKNDVTIKLFTKGGGCSEYLEEYIDNVITENPDVVLIEFGMNDHLNANIENLEYFEKTIRKAVNELKKNQIDVALVGFFQQNPDWILEIEDDTISYNQILKKIANDENIYFADIYNVFKLASEKKNIYEDLTADYMHHPTDFAHQLYLSSILPLFIRENQKIKMNQTIYYLDVYE